MRLFAAASISTLVSRLFVGADHGLPWGLLGLGGNWGRKKYPGKTVGDGNANEVDERYSVPVASCHVSLKKCQTLLEGVMKVWGSHVWFNSRPY